MPGEGLSGGVPKGGNRSTSSRTLRLQIMGGTDTLEVPAMICTKVSEVRQLLADRLLVNPDQLSFFYKAGAYVTVQKDSQEIQGKTLVKGITSFRPQAHQWPHPIGIIGTGYHGLKTGLTYLKDGNSNIVLFDRNDRVGGYCWITGANKTSKLQTEFGSFHVWWGPDFHDAGKCGGYPDCNRGGDWSIWPGKEEIQKHFHYAAEEYGLLPHCRFQCNVSQLEIVGGKEAEDRYYNLTVDSLTGGAATQAQCSVLYNFPGSLTRNRIVDYPGEDAFDGEIRYGMNDDTPYEKLARTNVAILGNGAFAVENARTCIESGSDKVFIVTRRKNLASPRIPCWFVHQGPVPTPGALVLKMFEPMYELAGFGDPWKFWSVHTNAERTNVSIIQNSRFGIGDVTFLMVIWGRLEYVVDTLKRCTRHTLHLTGGRKLSGVTVILKALGLLGDFEVDRLHGMKELVGNFCAGDWRRVLMIDATGMNAANFTTFSTGIGTTGFVIQNKFLHDFPREFYKMQSMGLLSQLPRHKSEEKVEKPAYLTDVKFSMSASIIVEGMCPKISMLQARFGEYKHTMYHASHGMDRTLEVCMAEWDRYQAEWKEQGYQHAYVPYPYDRELVDGFFKDWSKLMKIPLASTGPPPRR